MKNRRIKTVLVDGKKQKAEVHNGYLFVDRIGSDRHTLTLKR